MTRYALIASFSLCLSLYCCLLPAQESAAHFEARILIEQLVGSNKEQALTAKNKLAQLPPESYLFAGDAAQDHIQHAALIIPALKPIKDAWLAIADEKNKRIAAFVRLDFLNYYRTNGKKNPAWDQLAEDALIMAARDWGDDVTIATENQDQAAELLQRAITAGCTDPLVRYCHARFMTLIGQKLPNNSRILSESAKAIQGTSLSSMRKLFMLVMSADDLINNARRGEKRAQAIAQIEQQIPSMMKLLAEAVQEKEQSKSSLLFVTDLFSDVIQDVRGDRKTAIELIDQAYAAGPASLRAASKGMNLVSYAWDARGSGWANSVTEDGWRLMNERLIQAKTLLENAWENDPTESLVSEAMLRVALGLNFERAVMDRWWQRAMRADPHNTEACSKKMYFLEPKWHGSQEDMITFGRFLLKQERWQDRQPLQLISAHTISASYGDEDTYYRDADVWQDMDQVFSGFLQRFPEQIHERTRYAYFAVKAQQWKIAHQQFTLLADKPRWNVFSSPTHYRYVQQRAKVFSSPIGEKILNAVKMSELSQHNSAITQLTDLSNGPHDRDTKQVALDELQSAKIRQAIKSGEWVSLLVADSLAGWEPLHGTWRRDGEHIIGEMDAGENYLLLKPRIENFELTGKIECTVDKGGRNVGVIVAHHDKNSFAAVARYGWSAWCLEENFNGRGRQAAQFPEGPLAIRIIVWNKSVRVFHNDVQVAEGKVPFHGRIGLGGYYGAKGSVVRCSQLRVRTLSAPPTLPNQPQKPAPGANDF
jgi:hypothetical protein